MKLKKEIQAIKELNEQEKQAQAAKAAAAQVNKISILKYQIITCGANVKILNMIVLAKYENLSLPAC